jgi:hypothetical protein
MKTKMSLIIACLLVVACQSAKAWCWCGGVILGGICVGTDWTPVPGTTVVTWTTNSLATDNESTPGCTYAGQPTPTNECVADAGTTSVLSWEVKGTAKYEIFGVSAKVGASITVTAKCGAPTPINGFCLCCSKTVGLKYKNTYQCGVCQCGDPSGYPLTGCSETTCGTLVQYMGLDCHDNPCKVPADCNPKCPTS